MRLTPLEPWIAHKIGLPADEKLSRAAIAAYQLESLRQTIKLAREKSRFYKSHFKNTPSDLASLDDLRAFPFTSAQDIRSDPQGFLCVTQDEIARIVTLPTSGTSGPPKRLFFTEDDQELTLDFFHVGMSTLVEAGQRVLVLLPVARPGSVGDLLAKALPRLGVTAIPHGPVQDVRETLDTFIAQDIDALVGAPLQVLGLARHSRNLPAYRSIRLKSLLLSTDHASQAVRQAIEEAWDCKVYDHFGMTETGLGGGVECAARRGYHLREADMLFEIVDPHSGEVLKDGEMGELVFTTLTRRGMPLIRYRTGDLSRFIPGACPCGTALKTLATIRTRLDGIVKTTWGDFCLADLDEVLFPLAGLLDFSAAVTYADGHIRLDVEIWWLEGRAAPEEDVMRALQEIRPIQTGIDEGRLHVQIKSVKSDGDRLYVGPFLKRSIRIIQP